MSKSIQISVIFTILFCNINLFAQYAAENDGYFRFPIETKAGIVLTNNFNSSVYFLKDGKIQEIINASGAGFRISYIAANNQIGIKLIQKDGYQAPALISLDNFSTELIDVPSKLCGQLSASNNGRIAYSISNNLVVKDIFNTTTFDLGNYSNLTPISPDGKFAVFNDVSDQLWIIDLSSEKRNKITDEQNGYFNPMWSPNNEFILYSSLNGQIFVFDTFFNKAYKLSDGFEPNWSPDSKYVVFYKKDIEGQELLNTDLYLASIDGAKIIQLTFTKNIKEMDPSFTIDGTSILYHTFERREIYKAEISSDSKLYSNKLLISGNGLKIEPASSIIDQVTETSLDIPYIHQVYDTPDWHNGHWSCAPTAAMMVLAYYNVLPKWASWCSWPSPGHLSNYGRYIAERYYYYQNDYTFTANDAGGNPTKGGYGYMWNGGGPYSKMRGYYSKHYVGAVQQYNPTYSDALNEINQNYPYTMCVMLTSSGHLIVANGLYMERTVMFNDPYGNKNTPGYPTYDGKNVMYDWPGYNNGFQNLNGVAWCITNHRSIPESPDTLVDDLSFGYNFYLHNSGLASMNMWKDMSQGFNGHFWYKNTTSNFPEDTAFVEWMPNLPVSGFYEVFAYIHFSNSQAALYKINSKNNLDTITIDQSTYSEEWASLGIYEFEAGNLGYVRLGDASIIPGQEIVFDAVRWCFIDSISTNIKSIILNRRPNSFTLHQNYPNPFNPSTTIKYTLPAAGKAALNLYDILGNLVQVLVAADHPAGQFQYNFNAGDLAAGIYIYKLNSGNYSAARKLVLIK